MRRTLSATAIVSLGLAFVFAGEATPPMPIQSSARRPSPSHASQYVQARTKALVEMRRRRRRRQAAAGDRLQQRDENRRRHRQGQGQDGGGDQKACGSADKDCGAGGDDDSLASIGWDIGTCRDIESLGCSMTIGDCHDVGECLECIERGGRSGREALLRRSRPPEHRRQGAQQVPADDREGVGRVPRRQDEGTREMLGRRQQRRVPGPCPLPGDGKAAGAIAAAEAKKIATICKACGGADKGCDRDGDGVDDDGAGTGGSDDLTRTAIGFPASCNDLTIPGGLDCSQPHRHARRHRRVRRLRHRVQGRLRRPGGGAVGRELPR